MNCIRRDEIASPEKETGETKRRRLHSDKRATKEEQAYFGNAGKKEIILVLAVA